MTLGRRASEAGGLRGTVASLPVPEDGPLPRSAEELAWRVLDASGDAGRGRRMAGLLRDAGPESWLALDTGVRQLSSWGRSRQLPSLASLQGAASGSASASASADTGGSAGIGELTLALALCHPDGRVREAALRLQPGQPLLPIVAVRTTDWAGPVRELALTVLRDALGGVLSGSADRGREANPPGPGRTSGPVPAEPVSAVVPPPAEAIVEVVAMAQRLATRDRGGPVRELIAETARAASPELLDALLDSPDRRTRRFAHRLAAETGRLAPERLIRGAVADPDVVVQGICGGLIVARCRDGGDPALLTPLLSARSPRVRADAVTALHRVGRGREAVEALTDRSGMVRACARWVLRKEDLDPAEVCRERCAGPAEQVSAGAAAALGECGTRADAPLLWPLLVHPRPAVRAQAVIGLHHLDGAEAERLLPLLDDPSASVVRRASAALADSAGALPEDSLRERLSPEWPRPTRLAALRLLRDRGGIGALDAALSMIGDPDSGVSTWARSLVRSWAPPDSAALYRELPPPEQERLIRRIDSVVEDMDPALVVRLHWYLGTARDA